VEKQRLEAEEQERKAVLNAKKRLYWNEGVDADVS
jgi:hypothetical protein